jgi:hypothetical protein
MVDSRQRWSCPGISSSEPAFNYAFIAVLIESRRSHAVALRFPQLERQPSQRARATSSMEASSCRSAFPRPLKTIRPKSTAIDRDTAPRDPVSLSQPSFVMRPYSARCRVLGVAPIPQLQNGGDLPGIPSDSPDAAQHAPFVLATPVVLPASLRPVRAPRAHVPRTRVEICLRHPGLGGKCLFRPQHHRMRRIPCSVHVQNNAFVAVIVDIADRVDLSDTELCPTGQIRILVKICLRELVRRAMSII